MESQAVALAKFASDNVAVVGSLVLLVFIFLLFTWNRRRASSNVNGFNDDLVVEETQNKTKKPAKARSKKAKSDKGVSDEQSLAKASQPLPNGHANKVQTKVSVSANKLAQSVPQSGSTKVDTSKQTKAVGKKQPKSTENLAELSGEWTVAVSKKKPKIKKEPSVQKDEELLEPVVKRGDLNEVVAVLKNEGVEEQLQVKSAIQLKEPDVAVSCDEQTARGDANPDLLADVELTTVSAKLEDGKSVNAPEQDIVDAIATDSPDNNTNAQKINKKKKKKNKNKSAGAADVVDEEVGKPSVATGNDDDGQIPSSDTLTDAAHDSPSVQNATSPSSLAPDLIPAPAASEISFSRDAVPVELSSQQGIIFDELGDEPSVTVAQNKKKKKPRKEN